MKDRFPYVGHDHGEIVYGPDQNFATRPMTPAELAAREPALAIAKDIYRHACYAGVCYAELWEIIAKAIQDATDGLRRELDQANADMAWIRRRTGFWGEVPQATPSNMREQPHCSTCGCGLVPEPNEAQSLLKCVYREFDNHGSISEETLQAVELHLQRTLPPGDGQ